MLTLGSDAIKRFFMKQKINKKRSTEDDCGMSRIRNRRESSIAGQQKNGKKSRSKRTKHKNIRYFLLDQGDVD